MDNDSSPKQASAQKYQVGQTAWRTLGQGLLGTLPLAPGVAAFGLVYGVMARQAGFTPGEALAMSLIVHAGSAQFTALGMWSSASPLLIVLTTLVINLRHLLMGASIAPYLARLSAPWKAFLALWMSDESYALSIARYETGKGSHFYFLGANLGIYIIWPLSGLVGALLGTAILDPSRYALDLVFPLTFLGLLMAFLKDRLSVVVALLSGALALLGSLVLPGKWYVIAAGLTASLMGVILEEVTKWRSS